MTTVTDAMSSAGPALRGIAGPSIYAYTRCSTTSAKRSTDQRAMSATLFNRSTRAKIHARLDRLSPASVPHWGTMPAREMVCHVADHLRVALGDIEARPRGLAVRLGNREVEVSPGLLRFKPGRQLLVHWLPWPRARIGAPPEMLTTAPSTWSEDIASLHALVDRVGDRTPVEP